MTMLIAYNATGEIIATLDYMIAADPEGNVVGLVDFAAHEEAGGEHTDIFVVDTGNPANPVKGAKVWPESLGSLAHDFRVELDGPPGQKRIAALVHAQSGHRRERAEVVQGSLVVDATGRTATPSPKAGTPAHLPLIGARQR